MITVVARWSMPRRFLHFSSHCDARSPRSSIGQRRRSARFSSTNIGPARGSAGTGDKAQFDEVVGVSLLAPCNLRFRRKAGDSWRRPPLTVEPRSAYLLSGPARTIWEHSISAVDRLRYLITMRTLVAIGTVGVPSDEERE